MCTFVVGKCNSTNYYSVLQYNSQFVFQTPLKLYIYIVKDSCNKVF